MTDAIRKQITTAGKLKKALENVSDETEIYAQVCGNDGGAWNLYATIGDVIGGVPRKLVISLKHPDLGTLPAWPEKERDDDTE